MLHEMRNLEKGGGGCTKASVPLSDEVLKCLTDSVSLKADFMPLQHFE